MSYHGAGVHHAILELMPPHELYVEPFGAGAVLLKKHPARASIVIDANELVIERWQRCARVGRFEGLTAVCGDPIATMAALELDRVGTFIYAAPPTPARELLEYVVRLRRAAVMVAAERCKLYDETLAHWRRFDLQRRRGAWINYAPPAARRVS